jgi:hypothetical protein
MLATLVSFRAVVLSVLRAYRIKGCHSSPTTLPKYVVCGKVEVPSPSINIRHFLNTFRARSSLVGRGQHMQNMCLDRVFLSCGSLQPVSSSIIENTKSSPANSFRGSKGGSRLRKTRWFFFGWRPGNRTPGRSVLLLGTAMPSLAGTAAALPPLGQPAFFLSAGGDWWE